MAMPTNHDGRRSEHDALQKPRDTLARPVETLRIPEALDRIKGVFLEHSGARLTVAQAARLAGVESTTCQAIVDVLHDVRFVTRVEANTFVRRTPDAVD